MYYADYANWQINQNNKGINLNEMYSEYLQDAVDEFLVAVNALLDDPEINANTHILKDIKEPLLKIKETFETADIASHSELNDFIIYNEKGGLKVVYNPDPNNVNAREEIDFIEDGYYEKGKTFVLDGLSHEASAKLAIGVNLTTYLLDVMKDFYDDYFDIFNDLDSKFREEAKASVWKQVKKQDAEA